MCTCTHVVCRYSLLLETSGTKMNVKIDHISFLSVLKRLSTRSSLKCRSLIYSHILGESSTPLSELCISEFSKISALISSEQLSSSESLSSSPSPSSQPPPLPASPTSMFSVASPTEFNPGSNHDLNPELWFHWIMFEPVFYVASLLLCLVYLAITKIDKKIAAITEVDPTLRPISRWKICAGYFVTLTSTAKRGVIRKRRKTK